MRRAARRALPATFFLAGLMLAATATEARAQFQEFVVDQALGPGRYFGPGGMIGNGFGYRSYGPGGYGGYYTGLYYPGDDSSNGPSPYYSPLYSAMAAAPRDTSYPWGIGGSMPASPPRPSGGRPFGGLFRGRNGGLFGGR